MASARKKADEKNMKTLRELASLQYNKYCFDCNQRGPTYVNVTIGSFVCTKCSGILRGLTPPHRVKSISMATFTSEEVDFLRNRGNAYCRRTWLGLYDGNVVESRDEQTVRDFMINKYEQKRYYLEAAADVQPPFESPVTTTSTNVDNNVTHNLPTSGIIPRHHKKPTEFVADFGSAEIYNAVSNVQKDSNMNDGSQSFFTSFGTGDGVAANNNGNNGAHTTNWNLPAFHYTDGSTSNMNALKYISPFSTSSELPVSTTTTSSMPSEDRYAALKDLASELNTQTQLDWNMRSANSMSSSSSTFSSPSEHGSAPAPQFTQVEAPRGSNPFHIQPQWNSEPAVYSLVNPFRPSDNINTRINGTVQNNFMAVPFPSSTGEVLWKRQSNSSNPFL